MGPPNFPYQPLRGGEQINQHNHKRTDKIDTHTHTNIPTQIDAHTHRHTQIETDAHTHTQKHAHSHKGTRNKAAAGSV